MRIHRLAPASVVIFALAGCGSTSEGSSTDAGDAAGDTGKEAGVCDERPVAGAPCTGSALCSYPPPSGDCKDTPLWVMCQSGKWTYTCVAKPPGGG